MPEFLLHSYELTTGGRLRVIRVGPSVELWWHLNSEDGLGTPVDPHLFPLELAQALGPRLLACLEALSDIGIAVATDVPRDVLRASQRAAMHDARHDWR